MQALHFSFAVGAFISPLLASPFIGTSSNSTITTTIIATTPRISTTTLGATTTTTTSRPTSTKVKTTLPGPAGAADENNNRTRSVDLDLPLNLHIAHDDALESKDNIRRLMPVAGEDIQEDLIVNGRFWKLQDTEDTERQNEWTRLVWQSRKVLQNTSGEDSKPSATTAAPSPEPSSAHRDRFQAVYIIIGLFLILMALAFVYFFCTSPVLDSFHHQSDLEAEKTSSSDTDFTNYILGLLFVFYFLYVGAEVGYGGYIYTFATLVSMQPKTAAHLNALFWGTFATVRGVSIFIASLISPLQMLILDLLGCIMSSLVLSFEASTNDTVLWVGTAVLGASMASLFPAGISWLESYAPVTGKWLHCL